MGFGGFGPQVGLIDLVLLSLGLGLISGIVFKPKDQSCSFLILPGTENAIPPMYPQGPLFPNCISIRTMSDNFPI